MASHALKPLNSDYKNKKKYWYKNLTISDDCRIMVNR